MDRLTKRENGELYYRKKVGLMWRKIGKCGAGYEVIEKLYELEELAEQGRLVELPCKVGDTVWHIAGGEIEEYIVSDIEYQINSAGSFIIICSGIYWLGYLNKTVFLTREEAEAKPAEMKGSAGSIYSRCCKSYILQ